MARLRRGRSRRPTRRWAKQGVILLSLLVAPGGCGGSGDAGASKVTAGFAAWVHDLQHRDVAAACNDMTPAFWAGFASQVNADLTGSGHSVSTSDCRAGLRSLLRLAGAQSIVRAGLRAPT